LGNVSEMTYFVSSGMQNLISVNQSVGWVSGRASGS